MVNLSQITSKIVGQTYKLGHMDCFMMTVELLRSYGVVIPDDEEYMGLTFDNYAEKYKNDPMTIRRALEYIAEKCTIMPTHTHMAGDILYIQNKNGDRLLAIDGGNGKIITAIINDSIQLVDGKNYKILRVFRWEKKPLVSGS